AATRSRTSVSTARSTSDTGSRTGCLPFASVLYSISSTRSRASVAVSPASRASSTASASMSASSASSTAVEVAPSAIRPPSDLRAEVRTDDEQAALLRRDQVVSRLPLLVWPPGRSAVFRGVCQAVPVGQGAERDLGHDLRGRTEGVASEADQPSALLGEPWPDVLTRQPQELRLGRLGDDVRAGGHHRAEAEGRRCVRRRLAGPTVE